MAKKSRRNPKNAAKAPRRRGLIVGGVLLLAVVCVGAFMMYNQRQTVALQLEGAVENHYTKGTAGASVVIKEFSDYA